MVNNLGVSGMLVRVKCLQFCAFLQKTNGLQNKDGVTMYEFREMQFFLKLSLFTKTRSVKQCLSHNQKMVKKFKSISKITRAFIA